FDVTVDQAGTYYVWARVAVHSKSYRTIWLAIDQAENYTNTTPSKQYYDSETPSFVWEKIATIENREEGESIRVDIKPRHGNSAMGILIDTFVVTADAAFKPTDTALLSVASINETEYASLETAIDAAPASSVIKLLKNVEAESIETEKYFTLDLNGYTLQVSSFGKYVNVVDNSTTKTGLLEVAADKCTLPPTNEQMPVYDSTKNGYVFATITDQNDGGTISEDSFKLIFRPSFGEGDTVKNTLLKNGGEAAGISIRIRLDWKVNNEAKSKFLTYGKYAEGAEYVDMIAEVYSLDKAFYINATGTNSFAGLKVTPYIESTTGVVKELTTFTINQ
ncbi:MAG: hypothetical protein IKA09_11510, partial [Lachnospiraceae bacterium]|nr:hypothetical protein [Lachnospiraceae bacterium]